MTFQRRTFALDVALISHSFRKQVVGDKGQTRRLWTCAYGRCKELPLLRDQRKAINKGRPGWLTVGGKSL